MNEQKNKDSVISGDVLDKDHSTEVKAANTTIKKSLDQSPVSPLSMYLSYILPKSLL